MQARPAVRSGDRVVLISGDLPNKTEVEGAGAGRRAPGKRTLRASG